MRGQDRGDADGYCRSLWAGRGRVSRVLDAAAVLLALAGRRAMSGVVRVAAALLPQLAALEIAAFSRPWSEKALELLCSESAFGQGDF
ncbi:MAG: hypothetical protein II361_05590 [Alistipes sp.]|nr:hypothetical protein [Alistipes sp.]